MLAENETPRYRYVDGANNSRTASRQNCVGHLSAALVAVVLRPEDRDALTRAKRARFQFGQFADRYVVSRFAQSIG
jgi:hypothetical protein